MHTKVVHVRDKKPGDVYIGRPSKWGNPFSHKPSRVPGVTLVETREEAVRRYREWVLGQPQLLSCLDELCGKRLVCWCAPELCHGHVLADLADCGVPGT